MLKKKAFYIAEIVLGACVLLGGIILELLKGSEFKAITGACLGIGVGLIAMGMSYLLIKRMEEKNPEIKKKNEVEFKDERNTFIRYKARAKAADIAQYGIIAVAYVTIIIGAELWLTLLIVGVYALYGILTLYFTGKYQKEI